MEKRELLVAKKVIIDYLGTEKTGMRTANEIYAINHNEEVLKRHILAFKDIFEKALEQLEEDTELIELLDVWGDEE